MNCTGELRLGFEFDRVHFIGPIECIQSWLPIVNSFTVHPAMLYLIWDMSSMGIDLRIGYFLKEITHIAFDWIFNFGFRIYGGIPYAALYCGGPLCNLIGTSAIHFMLSFVVTTNVSCFLFLFARMHNHAVAGSNSIIYLSKKTQITLFMVHIGFNIINTAGFTIFSRDGDHSTELAKAEVYLLGLTLLFTAPIPVVLTIDSVRKLLEYRKATVSIKTQQMTNKLLSTFLWQCVVAMFHMFFPLTMLYTTMMIDYHESVSEGVMTAMRVVPLIALTTDSFHSSLIFILKTRGHNKILALFSQKCQRIRPKSKSCVLSTQVTRID